MMHVESLQLLALLATVMVENGERYGGALPFEEVRRRLDAASPPRR